MISYLAKFFDKVLCKKNIETLEGWVVQLAITGMIVHLALHFINQIFFKSEFFSEVLGHNLLSSIYTPFSFVLFFEVFLMVVAIPESFSKSIGIQFQIMALIVVRSALKEIGSIRDISQFSENSTIYINMALDLTVGLFLYFLIGCFEHLMVSKSTSLNLNPKPAPHAGIYSVKINRFIKVKKAVSIALIIFLVVLAFVSLGRWVLEILHVSSLSGMSQLSNVNSVFYLDYFSLLIFVDVFLVLYSLKENTSFQFVFRNVGFVVSTIIMRLYFVSPRPYNLALVVLGVLFGTITLAISRFYQRLDTLNV